MSRSAKKRGVLLGAALATCTTLVLALGLGLFAGTGGAASVAIPVNTSPPTIAGSPQEGQTLTGDKGQWSGSPTSYTYVWTRCTKQGGSCANISGATATTYKITAADVGQTLRIKVEAKNADGSASDSSVPTNVIVAAKPGPSNTSPPTLTGTPKEGQKLTGRRGQWSGSGIQFAYFWLRCDRDGGSCSNISGATGTTYVLVAADVGNTTRFKVDATNAGGTTSASSAPSAIITSGTPTPATGCPSGTGGVQVADVGSPARLLIDGQQSSPNVVRRGEQQVVVRYHVSACGGRSVQGALVYGTAVPFNQLSIPPEATTGADGWAELDFRMLSGFPVSGKQQLIAFFVRARKSGESTLGGISTRRLFSVPVNLNS